MIYCVGSSFLNISSQNINRSKDIIKISLTGVKMEMEIDENHSHGAEITRTEITDNNKHQIHTTLGRENSNQAEDEPFLGM